MLEYILFGVTMQGNKISKYVCKMRNALEMPMEIQTAADAVIKDEYGCDFRRLFPWKGRVEPPWGSAWATIKPGTRSTPHSHDEEETFIVIGGRGLMTVDGETRLV